MTDQEYFTVAQASQATGRARNWLYRALKDGRVEGVQVDGRGKLGWRIPAEEIERLKGVGVVVENGEESEVSVEEVPADVDKILAELGGESSQASLFRKSSKGHLAYLRGFATDEFSLSTVADLYGGGNYTVKFLRPDGTYVISKAFEIEGPPKVPSPPPLGGTPAGAVPGVADGSAGMMLTMMREMLLEFKEAMRERSGGDPMEMALKMAELIQGQTRNAIEGLKLNQPSGSSFGVLDGIELFERAMTLGQSLGGEGGGGGDMLSRLGGEVIDVLREKRQEEKEASAGVRSISGGAETGHPPPSSADAAKPAWVPLMSQWVPQLLGWARAGKRVDLYADVVADNLPDAAATFLWQQIPDPNFIESFYREFPACVEYRWWFDQMFATLHLILAPEPEELDEEDRRIIHETLDEEKMTDAAVGRGPGDVSNLVADAPAGESGGTEPLDDPGG
ncbi:MAG: helix-turn-helix domain-containing protein [Acidobacteriota bacterium]